MRDGGSLKVFSRHIGLLALVVVTLGNPGRPEASDPWYHIETGVLPTEVIEIPCVGITDPVEHVRVNQFFIVRRTEAEHCPAGHCETLIANSETRLCSSTFYTNGPIYYRGGEYLKDDVLEARFQTLPEYLKGAQVAIFHSNNVFVTAVMGEQIHLFFGVLK